MDNGKLYAHGREEAFGRFGRCLSGSQEALFLVLFAREPGDAARDALVKTAQALGYGSNGACFAHAEGTLLSDPQALFALIEGLDPLCIVICDEDALQAFARAYRIALPQPQAFRAACRDIRALTDIDVLMESREGKQLAWAALKTLPKI